MEEPKGGFLLVDKPKGWTSHDVVAKLRRILNVKKVGHAGTLDPIATGLLVVAVGREFTRQIDFVMKQDKRYLVTFELGKRSDTYDAEGEVEVLTEHPECDVAELEKVLATFWGDSMQMPPVFSAKKVGGVPAHRLVRRGKTVELKPVQVHMEGDLLRYEAPFVTLDLHVSSGTYIRSLGHDLGERLGCGALMVELRRTEVGPWSVEAAYRIEDIEKGDYDWLNLNDFLL